MRAKGNLHPTRELLKDINYTLNHWRALTRLIDCLVTGPLS